MEDIKFKTKWGYIYHNLKLQHKVYLTYRLWFCLRRAIFIGSVFHFKENLTIQLSGLLYSNLLIMVYHGYNKPFKDSNQNRIELMNEFFMTTMSFFTLMFTDWVDDVMVKYQYGWVFIILISIDIFINLLIILFNCARRLTMICKKYKNRI